MFATTKVEGTDNVYVFRYQGHQSMFVVTQAGVIATDPIGLGRPQAVTTYIDEIKKVTSQPIKYVIYSHSHYDHIAGGKPFKDLGATLHRPQERQGAARAVAVTRRRDARRGGRQRAHDHARRHDARAASTSGATTPTTASSCGCRRRS